VPYIKQDHRKIIDEYIDELVDQAGKIDGFESGKAGIFNYIVTRLGIAFVGENVRYAKLNEIIGAMECAKLEFYRKLAAPYEDEKIADNGDVY